MHGEFTPLPARFVELKQQIAGAIPDFEQRATKAWSELLKELKSTTDEIASNNTDVCPQCSQLLPLIRYTNVPCVVDHPSGAVQGPRDLE